MAPKKTILVVDDFENTRFVIDLTLKMAGYEILKAVHGEDAMQYLDGRTIDIIITDFNMPVMNGLEFTKAVRKSENYKNVPILMLTTETDETKRLQAQREGVTWWIKKPFERNTFIKIIEKALR
jgi:two-component system, chemotaxis family, chemotaxis protein CheY